jgi:hypothetical protein
VYDSDAELAHDGVDTAWCKRRGDRDRDDAALRRDTEKLDDDSDSERESEDAWPYDRL